MKLGSTYTEVEVCVTPECKSLLEYLQNSQEWIVKDALNDKVIVETDSLAD